MDQQGFPWEWVLLVVSSFGFCVFLAFDFFVGFFPFLFLFDARRTSHRRTGFWLAIKGGRPLQVVVSFPSFCSFGDNSVLFRYCLVKRPFCTFLLVSLIKNFLSFLFLLSPILWLGIFFLFFLLSPTLWLGISFLIFLLSPTLWLGISFLFFFASEGKDWHSHPGSRFMVS